MLSRERILGTIGGKVVDHVPIYAPYITGRAINPLGVPVDISVANLIMDGIPNTDEWVFKDLNYLEVLQLAEEKCEKVWTYGFPQLDRRFFLISKEHIKVAKIEEASEGIIIKYLLRTPKGNLEYICEKKRNMCTVWDRKPLINDKGDVEKLLSVPFEMPDIDKHVTEYFSYKNKIDKKGGTMYTFVSTPLVCVSKLFGFDQFLEWCLLEEDTIEKLVQTTFERIYLILERLLQKGIGPIIHFGGSEQATPPMMSPRLYEKFSAKYDGELFKIVHNFGNYVAVHCHGKVKGTLDRLVEMGVDLLDPVEAPPSGDIYIGDAKEKVYGKITIVGNIQFSDLEACTPSEIDKKVKTAIFSGGKQYFILATTEGPIAPVSSKLRDNYIQFIESGCKYGELT